VRERCRARRAVKFIGSIGCKSSSCHGGAGEKRSQYITWSQKDFHTRAYTILLDARSARIGEALGIAQTPSSARLHGLSFALSIAGRGSTRRDRASGRRRFLRKLSRRGRTVVRGHTRGDWTYATRVSAGMHDLRNVYVRANACVACHQNVDADILKAGHPELVFELDSQSINEPKHWRDDDPAIGPRSWLIGQAVALREIIWAVNNAAPDQRDRLFAQASALTWVLDKAGLGENVSSFSSFPGIQLHADGIARQGAKWNPTNDQLMSILQTLAVSDSEFRSTNTSREDNFIARSGSRSRSIDFRPRLVCPPDRQGIERASRGRAASLRFRHQRIRGTSPGISRKL